MENPEKDASQKIVKEQKVFLRIHMMIGTFFGDPLVVGYMFAHNYRELGKPEMAKRAWLFSILAIISIITCLFLVPENTDFPNHFFPIIFTFIIHGLYKTYMDDEIELIIRKGGLSIGWGKQILATLASLGATFGIIFLTFFIAGDLADDVNYTSKIYVQAGINHTIQYEESNISGMEVDQIAEAFKEDGFFNEEPQKFVHLEKSDNKYLMYIPVVEGFKEIPGAEEGLTEVQQKMAAHFDDEEVVFVLFYEYLDNEIMKIK